MIPKWILAAVVSAIVIFFATPAITDEWRPRHPLYPADLANNLPFPAGLDEVFLAGPKNSAEFSDWLAGLKKWRDERRNQLRYDGSQYDRADLAWTQRVFSQVQLLIWDRSFYDPEKSEYTVDRFLRETEDRIGPIDAVLIWHVYPNLGVDDRNQFDLLRDLPGGITGVRAMVQQFHAHGVKVFFPVIAWDTGTRDEGIPAAQSMARLMKEVGADGINFDTLESIPREFQNASDAAGVPLALEPQFDIHDQSLAWSNLGWNDWVTWEGKDYPFVPMVSRSKSLEPRHMVNVTDRFTRDKTDSLQHAFFNGQGYTTMENLWGFWYGMNENDAEALLRFTQIERAFAENLRSPEWEPHTPTIQDGIFASKFPGQNTLWTVVNRNEYEVRGEQLRIEHQAGIKYFDLWHGTELTPRSDGEKDVLNFEIEGRGFGAVLARSAPINEPLGALLAQMRERSKRHLSSYSRDWKPVTQNIIDLPATASRTSPPAGMVLVPEADYDFEVHGIEIEGGNDPGVDIKYPWEDVPRRFHQHRMHINPFYIDRTPATNAEFKKFLDETSYYPKDIHNFLRDWKNGSFPAGWGNQPVTWVSIEDARAYAAWAGKRLPHEWEWQFAAQSNDGRLYPWGNTWNSQAVPAPETNRSMQPLRSVGAFPQGSSPHGVLDMEGLVLQWTDEYRDPHTRSAILRGGSNYRPQGSVWYFPQTYRLDEHQKYLLMSPGRDRAATIGFRCVMDTR
jgi:formylglycine-generating enzyme required for sulfatase activity